MTMTTPHAARVPFEPGTIIAGRYRVISLIGVGGIGRVYLARHIELDTDVAIKVLRPDMSERPEAMHRFAREAQASVRLRSERIARVFDVGAHEGTPFFVMEHLLGCDLLQLRQQEAIDIPMLCEFFVQACEGLAEAHAQGVVHRDIKPDNLFVVRDSNGWRTLKIFDFGISKVSLTGKYSDVDLAGRNTELIMGTPHYISPEQIRSTRDVDHRTDIWSLGVVMFEVLSGGVLPFRENREMTALIAEVLEEPHRSLLDVAPNVPEALASIIDRCLVKDREQRYQTAAEVAVDLLPFCPARARASAERAVAAMQVAGLIPINADMASLRPSQAPLSDLRNARTLSPGQVPASSRRPKTSAPPVPLTEGDETAPKKPWSRPRSAALVGLLLVITIAGLLAYNGAHEAPRAAPSATPSAQAPAPVVERAARPSDAPSAVETGKQPASSASSARALLPPRPAAPAGLAAPRRMGPASGGPPSARPMPPESAQAAPPKPIIPATRLDVIRER